jgi:hypothetical protein
MRADAASSPQDCAHHRSARDPSPCAVELALRYASPTGERFEARAKMMAIWITDGDPC